MTSFYSWKKIMNKENNCVSEIINGLLVLSLLLQYILFIIQ